MRHGMQGRKEGVFGARLCGLGHVAARLTGGFAQVIGCGDEGVVSQGGEDAVVMKGDDEVAVAEDGGEVELLARDGEDAIPPQTAGAIPSPVDEGAHEIAHGVEVGFEREMSTGEGRALDECGRGEDAGLGGEEIGEALGLGRWSGG